MALICALGCLPGVALGVLMHCSHIIASPSCRGSPGGPGLAWGHSVTHILPKLTAHHLLGQPCTSPSHASRDRSFHKLPGALGKLLGVGSGGIGLGSHHGVVGAMLPWWGFLCLVSEALGSGGRHPSSGCSLWGSCWPSPGLSSSNAVSRLLCCPWVGRRVRRTLSCSSSRAPKEGLGAPAGSHEELLPRV